MPTGTVQGAASYAVSQASRPRICSGDSCGGQAGETASLGNQCIRCHHAWATTVCKNGQAIARLRLRQRQCLDSIEQLGRRVDAQYAGAAKCSRIPASEPASAPVYERAALPLSAALTTTTGFARAASRAADMNLRACVVPPT